MSSEANSISEYSLVSSDRELNELCDFWQSRPCLGLDTEFMRVNTFYPQLALLQVNDGTANYLIDPLQIGDWDAFTALMLDPAIVKIFHSCSEDLLVFAHKFGLLPAPVFDTQIGNAFLNEGFALSYQNMVANQIGHELPKGETRSDWLRRPLSRQQLEYAALDVEYLPTIYNNQKAVLEEQGRLQWLEEDCQRLLGNYREELEQDFSQAYAGFSAAWQLDEEQLVVLKLLAEWREIRARQRDKPKNWILRDHAILEIAKSRPTSIQQLRNLDHLSSKFVQYEGKAILELISQAAALPPMENHFPRPLNGSQKKLFKKAQALVKQKAESLSLPVEILGRKRLLLALFDEVLLKKQQIEGSIAMEDLSLPEEFSGWRKDILLPDMLELLQ